MPPVITPLSASPSTNIAILFSNSDLFSSDFKKSAIAWSVSLSSPTYIASISPSLSSYGLTDTWAAISPAAIPCAPLPTKLVGFLPRVSLDNCPMPLPPTNILPIKAPISLTASPP